MFWNRQRQQAVPPQPTLTREQAERMLGNTHFTSHEPEDGAYISFVWGFDPYPEALLPSGIPSF